MVDSGKNLYSPHADLPRALKVPKDENQQRRSFSKSPSKFDPSVVENPRDHILDSHQENMLRKLELQNRERELKRI